MPETITTIIYLLLVAAVIVGGTTIAGEFFKEQTKIFPAISQSGKTITGLAFTIGSNFFTDDYGDATGISVQNNVTVSGGTVSPAGATGGGEIDPNSSGLLALWHLNGDTIDSKGTNNGTLCQGFPCIAGSGPNCSVVGKFNQACSFDNTDDYILFGDPSYLEGKSAFSVAAWVKTNSSDALTTDVIINAVGGGNDLFSLERATNESINFIVYEDITNLKKQATFFPGIRDTAWHHIVGVFNGVEVAVYIDGVKGTTTAPYSGLTQQAQTNPLRIGYTGTPTWDGIIDEVAIWSRALSDSEIASLATAQSISASFESIAITPPSQIYSLTPSWTESGSGVSLEVSFNNGASWCAVGKNQPLNNPNCPFPASSFKYRANFSSQTS
ncbi:MAG: LamG domain-containing protein, partial [Candidatus Diapherotrites archaeon]|nr:LamG domain-containing protein [Candidatus Diapherotrites archaeon]